MAIDENWHHMVDASFGGAENYPRGIYPNPWVDKHPVLSRRKRAQALRDVITRKIEMLFSPRFITSVETCEMLEALVAMTSARNLLELGTHTGFGALHMLRAIAGDDGAKLVSIDARPSHDQEFFTRPEIAAHFEFISGWTPQCLDQLAGRTFDFVFVDSDHSVDHTQKELQALAAITRPGTMICFHDCPEWQTPSNPNPPPVRQYLKQLIHSGDFSGMMLPSPRQLDCMAEWSSDYPIQCSPGLAVLIRK